MARTDFKSVDQYIATHPEDVRTILQQVGRTILRAMPGAEEVISYQIPAYKLRGHAVIYFAGWKQHFALYPATGQLVSVFRDDLAPYEVTKGTIRFPLTRPVPLKLIERIARFRAKEAAQPAKKKSARPGRRR